ncbi:hypothetical protein [Gracilimonas halophila]|uniref:Uncharacterized protein n=1 Tax=Gracilimonas halophila TaxID=1834464 RepID=A0ABW5JLI4_9BACT
MQKFTLLVVIALITLGSISCNLLTAEDGPSEYPTVYPRLEMVELQELNNEYHQANDGRLCSTLNEYGLTGFSKVLFEDEEENPCDRANRSVVRIEMNNSDTLVAAAKRSLLKNSVYTGVRDTSKLVLNEMSPQPGCINCRSPDEYSANIEWSLTFENQVIDSVEIPNTEIIVFLDALGVNRIWGNWYSEFKVPEFVNFGYLDVQEGMVGWQIDMRNYTEEETIYTVQEEDVTEQPYKVYLPVENEEGLQIRTCWAVPISNSANENFEGWLAYVDIKEGFLVDLVAK